MESTTSPEKGSDVLGAGIQEDLTLEQLGYHQGMCFQHGLYGSITNIAELKRSYGLLDMIGFSFSIVTW